MDAKVGPQSKMLGRSSITPCVLNVELDAELQGGFPRGVGEEPEAGRKALWVREVPEVHLCMQGERTWSDG